MFDPAVTPRPRVPHLRFDTTRHARRRQFEAWREAVGVTHDITAPGTAEHEGLIASSDVWRMGQAVVSHRRFPMLHFARPVRRARVDGLDQYLLLLMREGMWQWQHVCTQWPSNARPRRIIIASLMQSINLPRACLQP